MSQCLRCNKPCDASVMLCEECRSYLVTRRDSQTQYELGSVDNSESTSAVSATLHTTDTSEKDSRPPTDEDDEDIQYAFSPINYEFMVSSQHDTGENIALPLAAPENNDHPERLTPASDGSSSTSPTLDTPSDYINVAEQSLQRLNKAAKRIAQDEEVSPASRVKRISRLTPFHDISADIQRENTVLPSTKYTTQPGTRNVWAEAAASIWPWAQEADVDEQEQDAWIAQSDPLMSRTFPRSSGRPIDEEDTHILPISPRRFLALTKRYFWMRMMLGTVVAVILLALILDVALIFASQQKRPVATNAVPTLTLSNVEPRQGERVVLHVRNFAHKAEIVVSRDIGEEVDLGLDQSSHMMLDETGATDIPFVIGSHWDPGFHTLVVEEVATRFTASATLRVDGAPSRPAHLIIRQTKIDLGTAMQGANSLQSLLLENGGGGSVNWSASSDSSWLLISPPNGHFSDNETVQVAADRSKLQPGAYKGNLTFTTNVGSTLTVRVEMKVNPLPDDAGAVLSVSPAVLAVTAIDGLANPADQLLVLSNPGSKPLHWEFDDDVATVVDLKPSTVALSPPVRRWLFPVEASGIVEPGKNVIIHVRFESKHLLPDTYTSTLSLRSVKGFKALNSPQKISVSLTVQRRCGLNLSAGNIAFTAVSGEDGPTNQSLSLMATSICPDTISWRATSSAGWLNVSPASGIIKGDASAVATVGINMTGLKPGSYTGYITLSTSFNTYTVAVDLLVQAPPPPKAPILSASPLNLSFSSTLGSTDPPAQKITIFNTGNSVLSWRTSINQFQSTNWLQTSPSSGDIAAGQTAVIDVRVNTSQLSTAGNYIGDITVLGTDAQGKPSSGSPQSLSVNLTVSPPCTLVKPSAGALAFSGFPGSSDPAPQPVTFSATGNCSWPLTWRATVNGSAPWLRLSSAGGALTTSGDTTTLNVSTSISGLSVGNYASQVTISAVDATGATVQGGSRVFSVGLNVLPVCVLSLSQSSLSFSVVQGQSSSAQSIALTSGANCNVSVTWQADISGSNTWLNLSSASGTFDGSGTVGISGSAASLAPGTYQGSVTFTATSSSGVIVQGSPSISVTLTVSSVRYQISGTVLACSDTDCTTSDLLPGSTVRLLSQSNDEVWSGSVNADGRFTITNLEAGTYTLEAVGNSNGTTYSGSKLITVNDNQSGVDIRTYPPVPTPLVAE